jgi:hypothetical protein
MPGVSPDVQSIVESVQPYHRDICAGAGFLEKLQVLNNWDKHRAFTTCAALISETDIQLSVTGATTVLNKETFTGPAEKGRMVARITVGQSEKGARIAPHPSFHMQLVFADNMPAEIRGERPLDVLSPAAQFIDDDLLPRLLPYL